MYTTTSAGNFLIEDACVSHDGLGHVATRRAHAFFVDQESVLSDTDNRCNQRGLCNGSTVKSQQPILGAALATGHRVRADERHLQHPLCERGRDAAGHATRVAVRPGTNRNPDWRRHHFGGAGVWIDTGARDARHSDRAGDVQHIGRSLRIVTQRAALDAPVRTRAFDRRDVRAADVDCPSRNSRGADFARASFPRAARSAAAVRRTAGGRSRTQHHARRIYERARLWRRAAPRAARDHALARVDRAGSVRADRWRGCAEFSRGKNHRVAAAGYRQWSIAGSAVEHQSERPMQSLPTRALAFARFDFGGSVVGDAGGAWRCVASRSRVAGFLSVPAICSTAVSSWNRGSAIVVERACPRHVEKQGVR